jgi:acyl-CoA thioesterase-1
LLIAPIFAMTIRASDRHNPARADTRRQSARAFVCAIGSMVAALMMTAILPSAVMAATGAVSAKDAARDFTTPTQCRVPDDTALIDGPLPRLARRLKTSEPLNIVVIGSGSAAGSGTTRREASFPYRLESRLEKAYPKAKLHMLVLAETGQTAPAMHARFVREVLPLNPALVIWQTGSADAARGIPVMEFGTALEHGIGELLDRGSDVLLVDGQFSPRASLLINTDGYRDAVRWNARRYDLPLFKRYDTMQYWWSNEVFNLDAEDKTLQLDNADRIHDCVAGLIFRTIQRGVGAEPKS